MEDENEKLERWVVLVIIDLYIISQCFMTIITRLLLSVLPQHVAVEMKGDIMSPVEVCKS